MPTFVAAEGAILGRILDTTYPALHQDLSRQAFAKFDVAQRNTAWALCHQRRFALVEGADLLASAQLDRIDHLVGSSGVRLARRDGFGRPMRRIGRTASGLRRSTGPLHERGYDPQKARSS